MVEKIIFPQYVHVDYCNLEMLKKSLADYTDLFCEIPTRLFHNGFIVKQQSSVISNVKENLKDGEFLVGYDFYEIIKFSF